VSADRDRDADAPGTVDEAASSSGDAGLNVLLALAPPVVAFAFASPPVVLTLPPRSLFPAPPVFAVAGREGAIASSIIRAIDSGIVGAVAVAPVAIRPIAPISVVPATFFFAPTLV